MRKLGAVRRRDVETVLTRLGWRYDRTKGDHVQWVYPERPGIVTLVRQSEPYHAETFARILKQMGIDKRRFTELLDEE
jgi:predicted RNA binding protein YcfA (HicA-like mRNA interferase family)